VTNPLRIGKRLVGPGHPTYVVAEMSANHNQNFDHATKIIEAAKAAGADAIKLQTYTADTLTIKSDKPYFHIGKGTLWEGRTLHDLYSEAYTPWDWQPRLKEVANGLGLDLFSTPFDPTSVDFLENMGVPVHKIASFEVVDIPLVERIAKTGKPIIMSTGMATLSEIEDAVSALRRAGCRELALLKCTSAYPAPVASMNLRTIPHLAAAFDAVPGLSDHTLGTAVPVVAVTLGACVVEKHFTLSRADKGPDSAFSLEPAEFKAMVDAIRVAEGCLGKVSYGPTAEEEPSRVFRRSLFAVRDIAEGETLSEANVRAIRPAHGLPPKHFREILGRKATTKIEMGTPLSWELFR
jgi:N-acetylneuraminate synthase